jgi:hypothetical protein
MNMDSTDECIALKSEIQPTPVKLYIGYYS